MQIKKLYRKNDKIFVVMGIDNVGIEQGPLHLFPMINRLSNRMRPTTAATRKPTQEEILNAGASYSKMLDKIAKRDGLSVESVISRNVTEETYSIGTGAKIPVETIIITGTINEQLGQEGEFEYFRKMLSDYGYLVKIWELSPSSKAGIKSYMRRRRVTQFR